MGRHHQVVCSGALIDDETVDYSLEVPLLYVPKTKREKQEMKTTVLKKMGLSISLKQEIYELSGGEQQRVAIARILLKSCDLIFADEPTGSLDAKNAQIIMDMLLSLNAEGKTVIIVTHDRKIKRSGRRGYRTVEGSLGYGLAVKGASISLPNLASIMYIIIQK